MMEFRKEMHRTGEFPHRGRGIPGVLWKNFLLWFDSEAVNRAEANQDADSDSEIVRRVNWVRCFPFLVVHLACIAVLWTGWSPFAVGICFALFWVRMFAVTAFYHRYFSHRSFKASRGWQFVFAVLGNSAAQRGPLWWASHHRRHHKHSDQLQDVHSPVRHGFWWSHVGWFMSDAGFKTDYSVIKDLARYPELRFLNRFDSLVPFALIVLLYLTGEIAAAAWPALQTSGLQLVVWGFFISTVILFHATFTINSLGHIWGKRRFKTRDQSRNNFWLALLTLGEGWHNNHHRFAVSARQGFYWWEVDISYGILKIMAWLRIVQDLNPVPAHVLREGRRS